jgi:murein DD-endopeptidase MepM/ murein hydrolase activator NlpD
MFQHLYDVEKNWGSWPNRLAAVMLLGFVAACAGSADPWWDSQYDYRDGRTAASTRDMNVSPVPRPRARPEAVARPRDRVVNPRQTTQNRTVVTPRSAAPRSGCGHTVVRGDTVYGISSRYNVGQAALRSANGIGRNNGLRVGQCLTIPGRSNSSTTQVASAAPSTAPGAPTPRAKPPLDLPPPATGQFIWPAEGRIVSRYGPKEGGLHNDGINIAVPEGTPVMAAQSGVVAYAGNELRGYGNLLLVRHADGWMTAYAHNGELLVERGATVAKGQTIATAGRTGSVQSAQVHFEIRRGSEALDPLKIMSS